MTQALEDVQEKPVGAHRLIIIFRVVLMSPDFIELELQALVNTISSKLYQENPLEKNGLHRVLEAMFRMLNSDLLQII